MGPLHGVPVTIKEAFAYTGSPNTWGISRFKDSKSLRTAAAVERLESAGAIVIGKTNVPVGLGDCQSYNPIYGAGWSTARHSSKRAKSRLARRSLSRCRSPKAVAHVDGIVHRDPNPANIMISRESRAKKDIAPPGHNITRKAPERMRPW